MFQIKNERTRNAASLTAALLTLGCALLAVFCQQDSTPAFALSDTVVLAFGIDSAGRFFVVLFALFSLFTTIYAQDYLHHEGGESRFFGFYFLTAGALIALAEAQSLASLYMCFEAVSFLSMPLVLHNGSVESRKAAVRYLGYSVFGACLFLLGWFFAAEYLPGSIFMAGGMGFPAGGNTILITAFFLMVLGFGAKAGILPLQAWLPVAHPAAPAPASALLSGLVTKGGVIAILRVTFYVFGADCIRGSWAQYVMLLLSIFTIFTGSMLALKATHLKKRLAYSSVSQISYVLFGLFLLNESGFTGAFLQIVFHAFAKGTLFLAAGAIIYSLNLTDVADLKGIGRRMRITMLCFTAASLSLIGIPPAGGFIAKWFLAEGGLFENNPLALAGVIVLLISAILTAFYLFEVISDAFFPGRYAEIGKEAEVGQKMRLPMIIFSAVILFFGFFPNPLIDFIQSISRVLL